MLVKIKKKDFFYVLMVAIFLIFLVYWSIKINSSIFIFMLKLFFIIICVVCCTLILMLAFSLVTKESKNSKKSKVNFYNILIELRSTKFTTKALIYCFGFLFTSIVLWYQSLYRLVLTMFFFAFYLYFEM